MDFFLENLILLVLIIIQSIFGIGLLLLGTPTFLLLKAAVTDCPSVSEPIKPEKDNVTVAVVLPL